MSFINIAIKNYISKLKKEQIMSFALMHNIVLSQPELDFTYDFIKNNYEDIIKNYDSFDLEKYHQYYSDTNFSKIKVLFKEYSEKFKPFLN